MSSIHMKEQKFYKNWNFMILYYQKFKLWKKGANGSLKKMLRNIIILTALKLINPKFHNLITAVGLKTIFFDWLETLNRYHFPNKIFWILIIIYNWKKSDNKITMNELGNNGQIVKFS